jgi:hypothetical protein
MSLSGLTRDRIILRRGDVSVALPGPVPGPRAREVRRQTLGRAASGLVYTYDKGVATSEVELAFKSLSDQQKSDLASFFANEANGVMNTFTYIDPAGVEHTARFLLSALDFRRLAPSLWSVTLTLELSSA